MAQIFVATTGNDTTGDGSPAGPYATWQKAHDVVAPGDEILIAPGTYAPSRADWGLRTVIDGTPSAPIRMRGYGGVPVLSGANVTACQAVLDHRGSWWVVEDIEVVGAVQESSSHLAVGVRFADKTGTNAPCNDVLYRRVNSHHHQGPAFRAQDANVSNITLEDCDGHHCYDPLSVPPGEHADGLNFSDLPSASSTGNRAIRFRAWSNSDDGIDLFDSEAPVTLIECWVWRNGWIPDTMTVAGNGMGLKIGQNLESPVHRIERCLAFENRRHGFEAGQATDESEFFNCTGINNGSRNFRVHQEVPVVLRNNVSFPPGEVELAAAADDQFNSWNTPPGITVAEGDFLSLDSTGADAARNAFGHLPYLPFARPTSDGQLIDAGIDVGLPFPRATPSLGAYEHVTWTPALDEVDMAETVDFQARRAAQIAYRSAQEAIQRSLIGDNATLSSWLYRDWAETVITPSISAGAGGGGITPAGSDQAEGIGTAITVVLPTHQADDVVVILLGWADHTFTIGAAPAGWTYSPASPLGALHKGVVVRRRVAGAGEANPAFTLSSSDQWMYKVIVLRGVHATTMDDATPINSNLGTVASAGASAITTVTANAMLLCAATVNAPDSMPATPEMTVPSGFTKVETAEEHASGGLAIALARKNQASAGASGGPHTFGWGGASEDANAWTYAFRPAGTSATVVLDYSAGHYQRLVLSTANLGSGIDTLTVTGISNPPSSGRHGAIVLEVLQDPVTGGRQLDFGSLAPRYQSGSPPVLSSTPGGIDRVLIETTDGGATWHVSAPVPYQA